MMQNYMTMMQLIDAYIERYGGIPWDFRNFDDERVEKEIRTALKTGIPYESDVQDEEDDL